MRRVAVGLTMVPGLALLGVVVFIAEASIQGRIPRAIVLPIAGGAMLLFWLVLVIQLDRAVRRRPRLRVGESDDHQRTDRKERRKLRTGVWMAAAGVVAGGPCAPLVELALPGLASALAYGSLIALCVGVSLLILGVEDARDQVIERGGRPGPSGLLGIPLALPWVALPLAPGILGMDEALVLWMLFGLCLGLAGSALGMVWLASGAVQEAEALIDARDSH